MLVFRTVIPLKPVADIQRLIDISVEWIANSPHHQEKLGPALARHKGQRNFSEDLGKEKFECISYSESAAELACILFEYLEEDDKLWRCEVVFKKSPAETVFLISLFCEKRDFKNILDRVQKPHLIKLLDDKVGFAQDGPFATTNTPQCFKSDEVSTAADIINGKFHSFLPCIYVSKNTSGEYNTDIEKVARLLSGVAHVFVEPNIYFSYDLQHKTDGRNPYNGAVGIFFPNGGVRRYLLPSAEFNYTIGPKYVFNKIKNSMIFGVVPEDLSFSAISIRLRQQLLQKKYQEKFEKESDEFFASLEEINVELMEENKRLREENEQLKLQEVHQDAVQPQRGYLACGHPESYPGQILDFLLEILEAQKKSYPTGTRARAILDALLADNVKVGEKENIIREIKALFRGFRSVNASMESRLKEFGLVIERLKGNHPKLYFKNFPQIFCTLFASGGDHRGGKNLAADIRKQLL